MLRPGNDIPTYHKEVGELMTAELIHLGLLDKTDVKIKTPNGLPIKVFHARHFPSYRFRCSRCGKHLY